LQLEPTGTGAEFQVLEFATNVMFRDAQTLDGIHPCLLRQAIE
jgi:hypothetical protein